MKLFYYIFLFIRCASLLKTSLLLYDAWLLERRIFREAAEIVHFSPRHVCSVQSYLLVPRVSTVHSFSCDSNGILTFFNGLWVLFYQMDHFQNNYFVILTVMNNFYSNRKKLFWSLWKLKAGYKEIILLSQRPSWLFKYSINSSNTL